VSPNCVIIFVIWPLIHFDRRHLSLFTPSITRKVKVAVPSCNDRIVRIVGWRRRAGWYAGPAVDWCLVDADTPLTDSFRSIDALAVRQRWQKTLFGPKVELGLRVPRLWFFLTFFMIFQKYTSDNFFFSKSSIQPPFKWRLGPTAIVTHARGTIAVPTAVWNGGRDSLFKNHIFLIQMKIKLYMKIITFVEIYNFVFSFEVISRQKKIWYTPSGLVKEVV
jgi:hypothetical protein